MKKSQVKVGEVYRCKVSGNVVDVRITAENPRGGWDAVNVATKRKVRIRSAQRLHCSAKRRSAAQHERGKAPTKPGKRIVTKAEYEAEAEGQKKDAGKKTVTMTKDQAVNAAMKAVSADKAKRISGLDAAVTVLAEAKRAMTTKQMVERMLATGLWKTSGKTPAATIYAAIIRHIAAKGHAARFRKVERGKFELAQ